jgi:SAM-dependent methyltransferase
MKRFLRRFRRESTARAASLAMVPPVSLTEEALGQALLRLDSGLGLFRLAHLLDALRRSPGIRSVLSIGSGLGCHEAFLAVTRPDLDVVGADLRVPRFDRFLPNLRFIQGDLFQSEVRGKLPAADLVYSIECLEHIEDDEFVFGVMVSCLGPGGRLYLQVPFANAREQADPDLGRLERARHEHVRPGYDEARLRALAGRHGLIVDHISAAFRFPLQGFVSAGIEKIAEDFLAPRGRQVFALVETDVRDGLASDRTEATAIKMLARRPGSA